MDPSRLKSIALFRELSSKDQKRVAQWADEVDLPAGRTLVKEGQFGWEFFVIESGAVEVRRGDALLATLGPGDFFGEMALLEADRRTATVATTEPTTVIVMTGQQFRSMANEMPEVAERIREAVEARREG